MIIVSGHLRIRPGERDGYLDACRTVVAQARVASGCVDFQLSADLLEPDRINVYEQWESVAAVEAFRGAGPDTGRQEAIVEASVDQHEVAATTSLT